MVQYILVTEVLQRRWGDNKVDVNLGYIVTPRIQGNKQDKEHKTKEERGIK